MLPHSYGARCLACSTSEQRENGKYVRCSMKKPIEPRPTEGKLISLPGNQRPGNSLVYSTGGVDYTRDDVTRMVHLFPKLIEALESNHKRIHQINESRTCDDCALLKEAKGGTK